MDLVDAFADFVGGVSCRWVALPWGKAQVWDIGSGPPVVLLHGIASSRRIFFRVAPLLAERCRVIVPMLRGEDMAAPDVTWSDLLDDLAALLRELDLEGATLLGASFGGSLALAYGGRRDPRVTAVAVQGGFARFNLGFVDHVAFLGSYLMPSSLGARYFAHRVLKGVENRRLRECAPGLDVLNADWSGKTPFPSLRRRTRLIVRNDLTEDVKRIDVPLTVAHSRNDSVVPFSALEYLRDLRPDARTVVWEDSGHLIPLTHPDRFAALV